jgi:hypothetical protein
MAAGRRREHPRHLFFIGAVFVLAAAMARTPEWRDLAGPSRRLGIVFIVLMVATVLAAAIDATGLGTRVLAITGAAGITGLAWRIARRRADLIGQLVSPPDGG